MNYVMNCTAVPKIEIFVEHLNFLVSFLLLQEYV
jgi:hypothetical protein